MNSWTIVFFIAAYFLLLILIARFTGRKSDNQSFYLGNRRSPWYVVAFGMVGASLSGVTFISVPGWVGDSQFSYMQMVLGFIPGYLFITLVLLPLYYRLQLTSIYTYLQRRFGKSSYKTGAAFFLLSRIIGASFRLYLVAIVLQLAVFDQLNMQVPFAVTVVITVLLIWLYTFRGGIRTIIWTDTLQTLFMLAAVGITIYSISSSLGLDAAGLYHTLADSDYSRIFYFDDPQSPRYFWKQFISGALITIVMTGLDQDMMQKNLSCRNIFDAQKNMMSLSFVLVLVNLLFLALGAMLFIFSQQNNIPIPEKTDYLFPGLAIGGYLGPVVGVFFVLGLIAAAYSSADSALTALTTSFCIDIMETDKKSSQSEARTRRFVHIGMSVVLILVIVGFKMINNESVIKELYTVAGYTYGPLLGLYTYGLFTRWRVADSWVPFIALASPVMSYIISANSADWFGGYKFGFEILLVNGLITFAGLFISRFFSKDPPPVPASVTG